jgi:hypothetical protein
VSDFDAVLERLLAEPSFAAALAADPATALAGYRLDPDEVALLHTQFGGDSGGQRAVETRANQSSLFGMLAPIAGIVGGLGVGDHGGGMGHAPGPAQGMAPVPQPEGMGPAPQVTAGMGLAARAAEAIGSAVVPGGQAGGWPASDGGSGEPSHTELLGPGGPIDGLGPSEGFGAAAGATEGFGPADRSGAAEGFGATAAEGFGGAPGAVEGLGPEGGNIGEAGDEIGKGVRPPTGAAVSGFGAAPRADLPPPEGYRTRVDVDGDGRWDRHSLRGRSDGGVDILVDANHDGRIDFVGRDADADGLVDSAEYDKNHDGFFEKRMYDDDGDGWMDRTVRVP